MSQQGAFSETIMKILEKELPSFFNRETAVQHLNGLFTKNTLAQLAHQQLGPPIHWMGRKVFYEKNEFLAWLRDHYGGMDVKFSNGFSRSVCKRKAGAVGAGEAGEGDTDWEGEGSEGAASSGDVVERLDIGEHQGRG